MLFRSLGSLISAADTGEEEGEGLCRHGDEGNGCRGAGGGCDIDRENPPVRLRGRVKGVQGRCEKAIDMVMRPHPNKGRVRI